MRPALALALALVALPVLAAGRGPRTIEDDWPRALAEARSKDVPLFVDAWAPW